MCDVMRICDYPNVVFLVCLSLYNMNFPTIECNIVNVIRSMNNK